jgi:RNA polymerase sigma factor (sigma-70 family)
MDDLELLREYVERQSEQAFAELVGRHVDIVYSTALRLVGDADLAKDVAQLAFTDLARQAKARAHIHLVAGWLYRRVRYAALDLLKSDRRRREREKAAMQLTELNSEGPSVWQDVAPLLEDAMSRLGRAEQDIVVLRFFQNKSLREVGRALGLTEDAARMRVSRALEKLRAFFHRKGVKVSLAVLAPALAANAVQAAPPGLAATLTAASLAAGSAAGAGLLGYAWLTAAKVKLVLLSSAGLVLLTSVGYFSLHPLLLRPLPTQAMVTTGSGHNLVQNPGFEAGTNGWISHDNMGLLTVTTNSARSGSWAALVSNRNAIQGGPGQSLLGRLQPGTKYQCSAWVRVQNRNAPVVKLTFVQSDRRGTRYSIVTQISVPANTWTFLSGTFAYNPSGTVTRLEVYLEGPAPGVDLLVDDVSVSPPGSAGRN